MIRRLSIGIALAALLPGRAICAPDIPSLIQRLVATDNRQREKAAAEAAALPLREQKQLATSLTPLLRGTDTDRREHAAEALAKLGAAAEPAIAVLQENLSDEFPYVRIRSAEALAHIGTAAVPAFIEALKNDNNEVRLVAAQALAHLGNEAIPAIPVLVQTLNDTEGPIRQRASIALENCGADAAPALMQALGDPAFKNRIGLVRVLGAIDGTPPHLPAQLTPFLTDPDPDLRLAAMKALTRKGQTAVSAVSVSLSADNALGRAESADILGDIGPDAASAVPLLISVLKDADAHVRAAAAHALGKMRDAGTPAIPTLREALRDSDRDVAESAQQALTAITVTAGGPHEPKDPYVPSSGQAPRAATVKSRSKSKPTSTVHMPMKPVVAVRPGQTRQPASFLQLNSTASVQALAMTAQKGNSEARETALAALASLLQNPDEKIRAAVTAALERIGTGAAEKILAPYKKQEELRKINRLMAEIQTSTGSVNAAIDALVAMGPAVVPAITQALKYPKTGVRLAAAQIAARLGPAASPAVPGLLETLNDQEEAVRRQAAKALETMNRPEVKNSLRWYYVKEKLRPLLKTLHISI